MRQHEPSPPLHPPSKTEKIPSTHTNDLPVTDNQRIVTFALSPNSPQTGYHATADLDCASHLYLSSKCVPCPAPGRSSPLSLFFFFAFLARFTALSIVVPRCLRVIGLLEPDRAQ